MSIHRVTSIKLPAALIARAANKSAAHRTLVLHAIKKQLKPVIPETEERESFAINLIGDLGDRLSMLSVEYGMTLAELFGALVKAGLNDVSRSARKSSEDRRAALPELDASLLVGEHEEARAPQAKFWRAIAGGLYANKVVMGEASTGVGKGRVIVSAAVLSIEQGKGPVIIAAPSIKVMSQLWAEFEKPAVQSRASVIRAGILPGRQEFVDEIALGHYLDENPGVDPAVSDWHASGGPSQIAGSLARAGVRNGQPLRWLMEDLRAIATALRAEDFALSDLTDPQADSALLMAGLRASSASAQIIFCTHTMLSLAVCTFWNSIPALIHRDDDEGPHNPVILIDEGHLFEESLSAVASDATSLFSLRYRLKAFAMDSGAGKAKIKRAIDALDAVFGICATLTDGDRVRLDTADDADTIRIREQLSSHIPPFAEFLQAKTFDHVPGIKADRNAFTALSRSLTGVSNNPVHLMFSPDRRFPSLMTGPSSVTKELASLWSKASGGVAIISASIYTPDLNGKLNCDHLRSKLALPVLRMETPLPVVWDEIYSPCLHLPSLELSKHLIPAGKDDDFTAWCSAQAAIISDIAKDALGGTLVLCTSYSQIKELSGRLHESGFPADRLIIHSGRVEQGQSDFVSRNHAGVRPVWLALGAAWTGLDVREPESVPADQDTLLTDLVITRLPIGLNRSNTMLSRIDRIGFRPVAQEALLMFKQGLGRPIRRQGLKGRNIWVLDGRLKIPANRYMADLASMALLMMSKYRHRREIALTGHCSLSDK